MKVICLILTCLSPLVFAASPPTGKVFASSVKLATPKKTMDKRAGDLDTAPFSIFVPDGVKVVRGVVLNPFYEQTVTQEHWRTAAAHWEFALAGSNLFGVRRGEMGQVVLDGLAALAKASGHPEVANAPLCLVGMSAGGGMAVTIAAEIPERVIAAAPVCLEVGPRNEASYKIPMITVFGERDGKQMEKLSAKLPELRTAGAQWAITVQWGRRHEFAQANNLIMPFFDRVIQRRYPKDENPAKGPVSLGAYPDDWRMWLGDKDGWDGPHPDVGCCRNTKLQKGFPPEDPTRACWLPDEHVARIWQAFVVRKPKMRIIDPQGLGDKQPLVLYEEGDSLEVRIKADDDLKLFKVFLHDGSRRLATGDGPVDTLKTPPLAPGIHSLIAVGWDRDGLRHYSRPHTILVRPR